MRTLSPRVLVLASALVVCGSTVLPVQAGSILREVWQGLPGTIVSDLTSSPNYPGNPTSTNLVTGYFEAPIDVLDQYGQRMHGYLVPPQTGNYTFWIASDDGGELWLSTDEDPANVQLIGSVVGWTSSRQWTKEANQQSASIPLQEGRFYYISALMKEHGGGDNLAVKWRRPDNVEQGPIPATYLEPWGLALEPPQIGQQPANTSAVEGQVAQFEVVLTRVTPATYQWRRNGVNLTGSTGRVLTYGPVTMTDQNARFTVVVSNDLGSVTSTEATLTVLPDQVKPTLVEALTLGPTSIRVTFSEPVAPGSATLASHYQLNLGANVTAAAMDSDPSHVLLTTSTLNFGSVYTLTVNNVTDLANTPNVITPNSQTSFIAIEYAPSDIGDPSQAGGIVRIGDGAFDVTGTGTDIGGQSDQMQFAWEYRTGDFDVQTRVSGLTVSDPYVKAGLMVRANLAANAPFAGIFTSSPQLGCFFSSRTSAGADANMTAPVEGYPVNYPQTWLRLRRVGSQIFGSASLDGQAWTQLSSVTLSRLPSQVHFGLTVTSGNPDATAVAGFRDVGPTLNTASAGSPWTGEREPLGPSSRRTGIVFSEIMYHPPDRPDGKNLEFVELYNGRSVFEDLSGWRISGEVDYVFPPGVTLQAGEHVVIAAAPADLQTVYGTTNVLGPYTNALSNAGGVLRLRNPADAIRLEVDYSDGTRWPAAADGAGHSLVLARPSYGETDLRAWGASTLRGGSPGEVDAQHPDPLTAVVINEILAHTDLPQIDFIELHNASTTDVDLSGCVVTDDPSTNRFRIPNSTTLPARGFLVLDETVLGFRLSAAGETVYLIHEDGSRVLDAVRYGAQENGVVSGRLRDGASVIRRLAAPTPGGPNASRLVEDIVINEIMYHPISDEDDDEFVEVHNRSGSAVDLSGWRFGNGIDFVFPAQTSIASGGYLVVARNQGRLLSRYSGQLTASNTLGDYSGSLADGGERLTLQKPDTVLETNTLGVVKTNLIWISVGDLEYFDGGRWGQYADGGGSSLELVDSRADPWRPSSWADSDESQKSSWTTVQVTGVLDNGNTGFAPDRLHIGMLGPGECLVDEVEVIRSGETANRLSDGGFENSRTGWSFFGNHSTASVDNSGAAVGARCLHLQTEGDGDTAPNTVRATLSPALGNGQSATIRARVRWLAGWPEVLFRLRGNYLELPARMTLPTRLGTPGQSNSRRVNNTGPAIYEVAHRPALPRAYEAVRVTCRVSDPDDVASATLRYRVDPSTTVSSLVMRDDGLGGDELAGDGVYSASISGRAAGNVVAFRVEAQDDSAQPASTTFPTVSAGEDCLVRWGDPAPFGSFAHYHLWTTAATWSAWNAAHGLNNTWRDATLVYGAHRVIYNIHVRDKGSPWHGGTGDLAAELPRDDRLLGATDRVFASTGNGGSEATGIRSQLASWLGQKLGIPYLHAHYIRVYRNGTPFANRNIMEDLEQPNHDFAEACFPEGGEGDLYKVAMWFEFQDNNSSFNARGATAERFTTTGGAYKLGSYRWFFQRRSNDGRASNYTNVFDMVTTLNATANYVPGVLNQIDAEEWIRSYIYSFVMGNWDVWSYNVGQNMYAYKRPGRRWTLMPWDIDFVLGLGDGTSGKIWGGQDPVINRMYDTPEFRRMVWRTVQDTINGPYRPENYDPQIDARRSVLLKNNIGSLQDPSSIRSYIEGRRAYLQSQLNANDSSSFAITSNGGSDYTSSTPTTTLTGQAPFAVATIEINGVPYTVTWSGFTTFRLTVPLTEATNVLRLVGKDLRGQPVAGAADTITVRYTGTIQEPQDYVVLNEVHYNPLEPSASFVEIYNSSATISFDLSGWRLDGAAYSFPAGAVLVPGGYLVLVKNRAAFGDAYGSDVLPFDEFPGQLDNGGETLSLIMPGATPEKDLIISDVRYDDVLPWPPDADGLGPSLQLIDPSQDSWRLANWAVTAVGHVDRVTPGRLNAVRRTLTAFPDLWINEVLPNNQSGQTDGAGDRDPWLEIHNAGGSAVDLSSHYLTDDFANLAKWSFPAGTSVGPGQFLVVWADGETSEGSAASPHTNFRLNSTNGSVALVRYQGSPSAPAVLDYVDYVLLSADRSIGAIPDGDPRRRRLLHFPTPGTPNNSASPSIQVSINEYMALNSSTIQDPVDGTYEDWFELYNAGSGGVDLTAYSLTDNVTNATQFVIPPGYIVPAGGFLLVWADNDSNQNSPTNAGLHVNFALSGGGEQIGLFAPDGSLVDSLTFGAQTVDVSEGLYPDGSPPPILALDLPSPGTANLMVGGNQPPVISAPDTQTVVEMTALTFDVDATDPDTGQTVSYSLGTGAPIGANIDASTGEFAWTPSESQGPATYGVTVLATDNGVPSRTASKQIQITVSESNRPPILNPVTSQTVNEGSLLAMTLTASDPDVPANGLSFSLDAGAPTGAVVDPVTGALSWTPAENQGPALHSFVVRVTDDGTPNLAVARGFNVTVLEVNNSPVLPVIGSQAVEELSTFRLTIQATDPDSPPSSIVYSLEVAPNGAAIDGGSGQLTWTPTEEQGPTNAVFIVTATESNPPYLASSRTFAVAVSEKNQAPTLQPLSNLVLTAGETAAFVAVASDADLPAQQLTFSLDAGAPAGATINASTGAFAWTPAYAAAASTNLITVRVTDNGPSQLSASRTLRITVQQRFLTTINEIMYAPVAAGAAYVELHNPSVSATANLGGLVLVADGLNYTFPPDTVLGPDSQLCVAESLTEFRGAYGAGLPVVGPWTGALAGTDTVMLVRPGTGGEADEVLDRVTYGDAAPWPSEADGGGASLQLIDASQDNDRVGNWAATADGSGSQTLIGLTDSWRYYQSGAPDPVWRTSWYDDASWPTGPALLYVENTDIGLPRQTPLTIGQSAYYFRTRFNLASVPIGTALELSHAIDDGAVFWLNGQELTRTNMAAGAVAHDTFASALVGNAELVGPAVFGTDSLLVGENVLAVEVHQENLGSSDIVMGCELKLVGGQVPAYTPAAPNNVRATLPEFPALRINEVLVHNQSGITDGSGDREPWIEIHNTSAAAISLDELHLTDDPSDLERWSFPDGWSILPGAYLVVYADGEPGETTGAEFHTSFRLTSVPGGSWNVVLSRDAPGGPVAVDALGGSSTADDISMGRNPDGNPSNVRLLAVPTPGAPNSGSVGPEIDTLSWNGPGEPVLSWMSAADRDYELQFKDALRDLAWGIVDRVAGTGARVSVTDTGAVGQPQRFYRLVETVR